MCKQYEELFKLWEENYSAEAEAEYLRAEEEAEEYNSLTEIEDEGQQEIQ